MANGPAASSIETGKDLIALVRDTALMVLVVLLLFWPQSFNDILTRAGFEEGSLVGFKWKAGFAETRAKLEQANSTIESLKKANEDLAGQLTEAKKLTNNDSLKEQITNLEQMNQKVLAQTRESLTAVQNTLTQTAPLANRLPGTLQPAWAVVIGGDKTLDQAKYELEKAAQAGIQRTRVFLREGVYRSVVLPADRSEADAILAKVRSGRWPSAYLVDLNTWCRTQAEGSDYVTCS